MTGRPVSSGSIATPDGSVRTYLHIQRIERIAATLGGKDAQLLTAAANAMRALSEKNRLLGRKVGRTMQKAALDNRGASFTLADAAEGICELAADGPVVAFIWRTKTRVRVTRDETLPAGAKRIGRFDISADYRDVDRVVREKMGVAA